MGEEWISHPQTGWVSTDVLVLWSELVDILLGLLLISQWK